MQRTIMSAVGDVPLSIWRLENAVECCNFGAERVEDGARGARYVPRAPAKERHCGRWSDATVETARPGRGAQCGMLVIVLVMICVGMGCGRSFAPAVVRVGEVSIDRATVSHWAKAISLGGEVALPVERTGETARERALSFLISSHWLIGEARDKGLIVSDAAIQHALQEKVDGMPNGEAEFKQESSSLGRAVADVKLEIRAELAAEKLSQMVAERVPRAARADAASYYHDHPAEFTIPALRLTDLIEEIPTRAGAIVLAKRLGRGSRFAEKALHERVRGETPSEESHEDNGRLVHAIYAAKLGTVAGPVRFHHGWALAVVRKILPARIRPLMAVEDGIVSRLTSQRRERARQRFIEAYRRKWVARTDCRPGFVVQKCSEYRGRLTPEPDPLSFRTY
jgi:parvulin-like peptidyl-prolyl cis-trans isomerase-like protein